jgi:hypothetical protein
VCLKGPGLCQFASLQSELGVQFSSNEIGPNQLEAGVRLLISLVIFVGRFCFEDRGDPIGTRNAMDERRGWH